MTSGRSGFDLVDEPWIPCRRADGTYVEYGIRDVLARAHDLAGISGDVPTQAFALVRLLLAALHGALRGPRDTDEWESLWTATELPADRIDGYLTDHRDRFDLLHPETPFFQVATLRTAKDETFPLDRLIADVPNNAKVFSTRRGDLSLSLAEAARWVVHCQAFDPSGIKSGAVGDPRVQGGRGYPIGVAWSGQLGGVLVEGRTLRETLLLNLVARDFEDYARDPERDVPTWERPPSTACEDVEGGRPPTGPVDLYTWQSRRIRLVVDGDRVVRVVIANGDKLTPQNRQAHEPHTAWRRSQAQERALKSSAPVYMPREHEPDKAVWRGLQSLLPAHSSRMRAEAGSFLSPGVLEWLGHLSAQEVIPRDMPVEVRATSMVYGSQQSVTDDIVHDTVPLRALLVEQGAVTLAAAAVSCVEAAEGAVRAVGGLAGDLVAAAGGDGSGRRLRVMEQVYADLAPLFRDWLRDLRPASDAQDVQEQWHTTVLTTARGAADELLDDIPPACWEGRTVRNRVLTAAHAELTCWKALRAALPYAFPVAA